MRIVFNIFLKFFNFSIICFLFYIYNRLFMPQLQKEPLVQPKEGSRRIYTSLNEEIPVQMSYQNIKLANFLQLELTDLWDSLIHISDHNFVNKIKETLSRSYNAFHEMKKLYDDMGLGFLYMQAKKLVSSYGVIFVYLIEKVQKHEKDNKKPQIQINKSNQNRPVSIIEQQIRANIENLKQKGSNIETKHLKRHRGIHLYNESYARCIDYDIEYFRNVREKEKEKERSQEQRLLMKIEEDRKFKKEVIDEMNDQTRIQVDGEELYSFLTRYKTKNQTGAKICLGDELEKIAIFFKQSQHQALEFLRKEKNLQGFHELTEGFNIIVSDYEHNKAHQHIFAQEKIKQIFQYIKSKVDLYKVELEQKQKIIQKLERRLPQNKPQTKDDSCQTTENLSQQIKMLHRRLVSAELVNEELKVYIAKSNEDERKQKSWYIQQLNAKETGLKQIKETLQQKNQYLVKVQRKLKIIEVNNQKNNVKSPIDVFNDLSQDMKKAFIDELSEMGYFGRSRRNSSMMIINNPKPSGFRRESIFNHQSPLLVNNEPASEGTSNIDMKKSKRNNTHFKKGLVNIQASKDARELKDIKESRIAQEIKNIKDPIIQRKQSVKKQSIKLNNINSQQSALIKIQEKNLDSDDSLNSEESQTTSFREILEQKNKKNKIMRKNSNRIKFRESNESSNKNISLKQRKESLLKRKEELVRKSQIFEEQSQNIKRQKHRQAKTKDIRQQKNGKYTIKIADTGKSTQKTMQNTIPEIISSQQKQVSKQWQFKSKRSQGLKNSCKQICEKQIQEQMTSSQKTQLHSENQLNLNNNKNDNLNEEIIDENGDDDDNGDDDKEYDDQDNSDFQQDIEDQVNQRVDRRLKYWKREVCRKCAIVNHQIDIMIEGSGKMHQESKIKSGEENQNGPVSSTLPQISDADATLPKGKITALRRQSQNDMKDSIILEPTKTKKYFRSKQNSSHQSMSTTFHKDFDIKYERLSKKQINSPPHFKNSLSSHQRHTSSQRQFSNMLMGASPQAKILEQELGEIAIIEASRSCNTVEEFRDRISRIHENRCGKQCKHLKRFVEIFDKIRKQNNRYRKEIKPHIENLNAQMNWQDNINLPNINLSKKV